YSSDIYAIGVTCLYLLTGKPPMEFDVDPRTGEICWQPYAQVSPHFTKVLNKMLKMAPIDRYQSADQVLRALDLEPYLDNLADCMTVKSSSSITAEAEPSAEPYLTPIERTAIEIRQWKARLHKKQNKPEWREASLVSSSCLS
ncbi:MAG: serine/threonine protein kinase, partial [Leptolyngbyaceae cyanobacterium SL_7_1]|nr:serine/threonine protein kinase [Leptolyngbyaceae cyanobacterium SL_7_1]